MDKFYAESIDDKLYPIKNVSLDLEKSNLSGESAFNFNISNSLTNSDKWSYIYGKTIEVNKDERYFVISNMGLNSYAVQSHIAIEGFNKTTGSWKGLLNCPDNMNGPLKLHRFVCRIDVDQDITKIRPVFKAGWSSEEGQKAITHYGKFLIIKQQDDTPIIFDTDLIVQEVFDTHLTTIAMKFLNPDDILIIDKNKGLIYRILNGVLTGPLADLNVAGGGLLGLESVKVSDRTYVLLFFTESGIGAYGDDPFVHIKPKCNCLYRYELKDNELIDPKLLFSIPSDFKPIHNGGVIKVGQNNSIYLTIGEMDHRYKIIPNKVRNFVDGPEPDGSSGILRFTIDGNPVGEILGNTYPLNHYYAYGIRNSFGMDFDPVTGKLWDTENGESYGDEINLVEPGFNSGYNKTDGIWHAKNRSIDFANPVGLVDFGGKGKYSAPELTWNQTVGPVSITFFNSSKLGLDYQNSMFVSDFNNNNIYNFRLDKTRTGLEFEEALEDKVANSTEELYSVLFGSKIGSGVITDIETGPDGFPYFLNMDEGKIYRIIPKNIHNNTIVHSIE